MRHTPATNSITSMVHPSAGIACKTKKTKFGPARDTSAKVVIQDGWSVPVVHSFEEFWLADTGTCLATRSEAEEAMRELRSGGGLAILTSKQVVAGSEEIEFEVKTSQGLSTMWKPTLGAAGRRSGHIQVFCAKRRSCGGRRLPCSDRFPQKVLPSRCVEDSHDPTATAYWLKKLGAEPSGLLSTKIRRDRWCGSGGQGSERQLRDGSSRKRGATNLPLSWSKAAVQAFLPGWPCTVEASSRAGKTRSAIIRSAVPPPHRRLQHDFGCSPIRPAEPRKRQNAQVLVWSKPGKPQRKVKRLRNLVRVWSEEPRATSDSETSVRWKRVDGRDSSRCHHAHPGSRQQPGSHASLALAKVATVGHPATSAISSAGRQSRSYRYSWRRCSRLRQLSDSSGVQLHSLQTEGNEKCRRRGRRVRRTRWFLLRSWRKRGGHGRSPRRAKIQLCQTYAVLSGVEGGAVFKASRRFFVAFSCAVHLTPCAHHQR